MNILIAEDHELIRGAYKNFISISDVFKNINFIEASDCEDGFKKILEISESNINLDLAIIDFSMPCYKIENINNGGDLCLLIKKKIPNCKTIILTAIMENITLFNITQNVKPDGLATKSDITHNNFIDILKDISLGNKYRSQYIKDKTQEIWRTNSFVNEINRNILHYLNNGYKINEIAEELSVSESTIKKRISKIKQSLELNEHDNLLKETKKRGYI